MAYPQRIIHTLYKNLLRLYPRAFRERLGGSMEQTFLDLCKERRQQPGHSYFLLTVFTETAIGIIQEHICLLVEEKAVKKIICSPTSTALISFILSLPLGIIL